MYRRALSFFFMPSVLRKRILFFCAVLLISGGKATECSGWWPWKTDECPSAALQSRKPGIVEKCLEHQIRVKNYPGILQIRKHARDMIWAEQNKRNTSRGISPEQLQKNIAPWMRIEKKATQFYKANVR